MSIGKIINRLRENLKAFLILSARIQNIFVVQILLKYISSCCCGGALIRILANSFSAEYTRIDKEKNSHKEIVREENNLLTKFWFDFRARNSINLCFYQRKILCNSISNRQLSEMKTSWFMSEIVVMWRTPKACSCKVFFFCFILCCCRRPCFFHTRKNRLRFSLLWVFYKIKQIADDAFWL